VSSQGVVIERLVDSIVLWFGFLRQREALFGPLFEAKRKMKTRDMRLAMDIRRDANVYCYTLGTSYGQVEYNAETAVNILVDIVEDQSGKQYKSQSRVVVCIQRAELMCRALASGPLRGPVPDLHRGRSSGHLRAVW
jgi:hypothetical protein